MLNKLVWLFAACILLLIFFFFMRGCAMNHLPEASFSIGQDSRWENVSLMGNERNLASFNNQLLKAIADKEYFNPIITITPAAELLGRLEEGKLQGILTALQPNYIYEQTLLFSKPYYLTGPVLIIPSSAPLAGWNELRKKIIAIPAHANTLPGIENDPTIQTKIYDDILQALADLRAGRIDGVIFPAIPAYTYVNAFYKKELKIATLPLTEEGLRLVAKNNATGKDLIDRFNQGLAEVKKDGTFDRLTAQWGLINTEKPQ